METIDPNQAARVWQRVRGNPAEDKSLERLILQTWEDANVYLQLSRRTTGRTGTVLRELHRRKQAQCACLRGIHRMLTGQALGLPRGKSVTEPLEAALRGCYAREMRSLRLWGDRISDPDYGPVFQRMTEEERESCRMLLELIGSPGR